jgi:hypothetical protein
MAFKASLVILFQADFRNFKGSHNKFMVTDQWAYIGKSFGAFA